MHVRHRPRPGSILATPGRRRRHGLTKALLAGGALLVGLSAPLTARAADVDCLTVADGGNLLTIVDRTDTSPATNEVTIGALGVPDVEAIAYRSATGVLYGADAEQLGIIDQTTALFVALPAAFGSGGGALGALTFSDVDGLAFDPITGTLYGAHRRGGPDVLIVIDPLSGVRVADAFGAGIDYVVIDPIAGLGDIDDIAIDPIDGQLYGVANNGGSGDRLVRIDKATGDTTDVGLIGVADVEGLTIDPAGGLWGATGTGGTASTRNSLYPLDKSTGVAGTRVPLDNGTDYEAVACNLHGLNTLSGMVFVDDDRDGIRDPGESSGTAGVTVRLYRDADGNGAIDPGEPVLAIVVTGAGGTYAFSFAATAASPWTSTRPVFPPATFGRPADPRRRRSAASSASRIRTMTSDTRSWPAHRRHPRRRSRCPIPTSSLARPPVRAPQRTDRPWPRSWRCSPAPARASALHGVSDQGAPGRTDLRRRGRRPACARRRTAPPASATRARACRGCSRHRSGPSAR